MALRTGSLVAITGPRSAAVGAPQRSGEGLFDASEEARFAVSNRLLRSFMVVTSLRAKRRARRSVAPALTHLGREKTHRIIAERTSGKGRPKFILAGSRSPIPSAGRPLRQ